MSYMLLKMALMATGIGLSSGRHRMLALCYFYVWALSKWIMHGAPGQQWYWWCVFFEAVIIVCALFLEPKVWKWIVGMSALNICANTFSLALNASGIRWFYDLYPFVIRFGEMAQCTAFIVYSDQGIAVAKRLYRILLEHRRTTWMLRLLKPLVG